MRTKPSPIPDGTDNFEQNIISDFEGYVSSVDPTKAKPNVLVQGSVNVYKKISGTIANRPGRKQYDPVDNTLAKIDSEFVWDTSLAATLVLRVSNSKFQVLSNITGTNVWYDLQTSLTLSRYVFDTVWDDTLKKDFLVFVRGDSNLFRWDGGLGLFVSGIAGTSITLDRAGLTAGFPSSGGTVKINGNSYTYTGVSGNNLTGVTGDPSAEPANSVVILQVVTNSSTPVSGFTSDFLRVNNNQVAIGSETSRLVYISKNSSYIDFSQSTPRVPGDGEIITLDNNAVGITVKKGNFWVSSDAEWYEISSSQITVGTTLTEQTKVDKSPAIPAYSHEMIDVDDDVIIYLSADQQVETIGNYRNLTQTAYPTLSQAVYDEFQLEDFTEGHLKVIGDFIYLVAPNSGRVYLHQTRKRLDIAGNVVAERLWHPPFIWGLSRVDTVSGEIIGFSNSNPQMYSLWDTGQWHDDGPGSSEPISLPYTSVMLLAYQNGGRRQGLINFDKMFYEGYVAGNLYEAVYYDYQGATNLLYSEINTTQHPAPRTYTGVLPPSLGDSSLGDNPLGDGLNTLSSDQALLPKFRIIIGKDITNCFEFAPMVYSNEIDSRWEIVSLGANISLADAAPIEIIK